MASIAIAGCAASGPYMRLGSDLQKDVKIFNNIAYLPLAKLCDHYGLNYKWDEFVKTAVIEKNGKRIALRAGSDRILADGIERRLDRPVALDGGMVYVPISFVNNNLGTIVGPAAVAGKPPEAFPKRLPMKTIVIDAGHGGKDAGAVGGRLRLKEKHMTLAVSKKLKKILEAKGLKVIMTRNEDAFIPLSKRVQIANRSEADLFVSIHINASRTRALKGFECYYLSNTADDNARASIASENAPPKTGEGTLLRHTKTLDKTLWDMILSENRAESAELARNICGSVEGTLAIKNRGIKSARFYVLKLTRMPAVLVEMGYLSNRYEEMRLKDDKFLEKLTEAVARGILTYKSQYEGVG